MSRRVYLDWNATAPLSPAAATAIADALEDLGEGRNPSSQHMEGRAARAQLERARRQIAEALGAAPEGLIFTSGATEAANLVCAQGWHQLILSAIEHDCVRAAADRAAEAGAAVRIAPVTSEGVLDLSAFEELLRDAGPRTLVAVMAANNETGAVQPVAEVVRLAKTVGARTLVDAAQAFGKTALDLTALEADFVILSGHKIGGPSGVGALIVRAGVEMRGAIVGGGQEARRRAGTENLVGAIGFGAAAHNIDLSRWADATLLRDRLEDRLNSLAKGLVFFARAIDRLPTTLCLAAPGWRAETQLMQLDLAGFAVSAGSACSSGKIAASHVLTAMGARAELASCAIRVSFGPDLPAEDAERFATSYARLYERATEKLAADKPRRHNEHG